MNGIRLGILAAILVTLGSFGGGATRVRGGLLATFNLEALRYGHGATLSNLVLWSGTILLIVAWVLVGKAVYNQQLSLPQLNKSLWMWVLPLICAAPIMSRDIYSYLAQGAMLRDGFDPYTQGVALNPNSYLTEVSHDWRTTTTPYGPLHLWLGELITTISGDRVSVGVVLFKLLSIAGFALIAWSIPRLAILANQSPTLALWLGVMNPLMIIHLIGGMHNESLMIGLVGIGLWLIVSSSTPARVFCAIALISLGVALKATAAFILPFVVWIALTTKTKKLRWFFIYAFGGGVLTIAVLALITFISGASWGWVTQLTGNTKVINPLAFPSLIAGIISAVGSVFVDNFPYNQVLDITRRFSIVIMAIGFISCWWLSRRTQISALRGATGAYGFAFVFNSVTLPWYYASIICLLGLIKPPLWLLKLSVAASIIIASAFTGSGNHQLYNPLWMIPATFFAFLAVHYIFTEPGRLSLKNNVSTPASSAIARN
ncbi:alpha-(1-_6)-mannopyranosyltransferase A [Corynebacterium kutscheri]|uniref:Alpha-(1->6)-mannopyranosyltransferase A n=1 Tax=Corynebacterium kutscheri TaxID=35755 RepID=A0AB38VUB1_9CORY|nr:alpha-(1->6)-mannopyranosyltransferase A [Corynebacterium kutscheri]VEH08853.1 alpha 1-->6 mannopyranosyltransferase [Corynebacterium kutscheri]